MSDCFSHKVQYAVLLPGMSKPKEAGEKQHEEEQEKEFYSRKRLRTRKKVGQGFLLQ